MKKILVILGHPRVKSYCGALAQAYIKGTQNAKADVKYIKLIDLKFDGINAYDFKKAPELEPDLKKMQKLILWSEHIVFVYPTWWGSAPALLKGFLDRIFTPGFAFRYTKGKLGWKRFLKGRSARIITTTGGPWAINRLLYGSPGIRAIKWATLWFVGIGPTRVSEFNSLNTRWISEKTRERWIKKVEYLGEKDAR